MPWSEAHVRRLFWRAGFGATPAETARWAQAGQDATMKNLLHGPAGLDGAAPKRFDPANVWADRTTWWLDRMVRTRRPLEEKLTLFWHDHFATAGQDTPLMLAQNRLFRAKATGSFRKLLGGVMRDPAMQLFLSLADSTKDAPNENFARELMELFTLGGGYTERDIREAARALTGFRTTWGNSGLQRIDFDPKLHDGGVKRIYGRRGRFGPDGVLDLVVAHPRHATFLTRKLWDFFITVPPDRATQRALTRTYKQSGHRIAPVVERILRHPALYADLDAPAMVKCPLVYVAGALRLAGTSVRDEHAWLLELMGQQPFDPPSVAGWDWGPAWMTSQTVHAGVRFAGALLGWDASAPLHVASGSSDPDIPADQQVDRALDALGRPWISAASRRVLTDLAAGYFADMTKPWQQGKPKTDRADMLQMALRALILSGPDAHLH